MHVDHTFWYGVSMNRCDSCGVSQKMVEHSYEGLNLCEGCCSQLDVFKGMDPKAVQSLLSAYRERKARNYKENA